MRPSQHRLRCIYNPPEIAVLFWRGYGDRCPDLVFLQTPKMIHDACLSQPGHHDRPMLVKPLHKVAILRSIALCLSNVFFFLASKEVVLVVCRTLILSPRIVRSDFKTSLPFFDFEESMTGTIGPPGSVSQPSRFSACIATTLLRVGPSVALLAVLLDAIFGPTDVLSVLTLIVLAKASQSIEEHR
jgi:hypothetical protein